MAQRDVPDVLPELPDVDPVELPVPLLLLPVPELDPDEPEPVSVDGTVTELVTLLEVSGVVEDVAVVVVSLVVDDVVGEVDVVVVVEPGVALVPELLYEVLPVLAPRLQPGRAAVASARTAT